MDLQEKHDAQITELRRDMDTLLERTARMATDMGDIKRMLREEFVSRAEFAPIKNVVNGLVALILTSVVGALIALIIKSGH